MSDAGKHSTLFHEGENYILKVDKFNPGRGRTLLVTLNFVFSLLRW
jgi:hypothetical protein